MRPKTLVIAFAPVAMATVLVPHVNLYIFFATLIATVCIQIGTNFANDYFDFCQKSDTKERKGPRRLLTTGTIKPKQMLTAMIIAFAIATIAAIFLTYLRGFIVMILLVLSIASGIFYTASKYSLKRTGLADLFVFLFFGPIATVFTFYLQTGAFNGNLVLVGLAPGLIPVAVLCVNNVRDVREDKQNRIKTIPVRFGKKAGQIEYTLALLIGIFSCALIAFHLKLSFLLPLITLIPAYFQIKKMWSYKKEQELNPLLAGTAQLLLIYTLFFCIGARL